MIAQVLASAFLHLDAGARQRMHVWHWRYVQSPLLLCRLCLEQCCMSLVSLHP